MGTDAAAEWGVTERLGAWAKATAVTKSMATKNKKIVISSELQFKEF